MPQGRVGRSGGLDAVRETVRELSGFAARFSHFPIVGLCASCARKREPVGR
jgi:hypothetical protein